MLAVKSDLTQITDTLIKYRADVNQIDNNGKNLIEIALEKSSNRCINILKIYLPNIQEDNKINIIDKTTYNNKNNYFSSNIN